MYMYVCMNMCMCVYICVLYVYFDMYHLVCCSLCGWIGMVSVLWFAAIFRRVTVEHLECKCIHA